MSDTEPPRRAKRGRELFEARLPPARPSKPPEDPAIRDAQSRHKPWGEKKAPPEVEDEEDE